MLEYPTLLHSQYSLSDYSDLGKAISSKYVAAAAKKQHMRLNNNYHYLQLSTTSLGRSAQ